MSLKFQKNFHTKLKQNKEAGQETTPKRGNQLLKHLSTLKFMKQAK